MLLVVLGPQHPVSKPDRHPPVRRPKAISDETRREAGLSDPDLWLRYFELGGMSTPAEVKTYLRWGAIQSTHDHDVLAHALNERFSELGRDHSVPYAEARR